MIMSDGTTTAMGIIFMLLQVRSLAPAFRSLRLALVSIGW